VWQKERDKQCRLEAGEGLGGTRVGGMLVWCGQTQRYTLHLVRTLDTCPAGASSPLFTAQQGERAGEEWDVNGIRASEDADQRQGGAGSCFEYGPHTVCKPPSNQEMHAVSVCLPWGRCLAARKDTAKNGLGTGWGQSKRCASSEVRGRQTPSRKGGRRFFLVF